MGHACSKLSNNWSQLHDYASPAAFSRNPKSLFPLATPIPLLMPPNKLRHRRTESNRNVRNRCEERSLRGSLPPDHTEVARARLREYAMPPSTEQHIATREPPGFPVAALSGLASRILQGDVVF